MHAALAHSRLIHSRFTSSSAQTAHRRPVSTCPAHRRAAPCHSCLSSRESFLPHTHAMRCRALHALLSHSTPALSHCLQCAPAQRGLAAACLPRGRLNWHLLPNKGHHRPQACSSAAAASCAPCLATARLHASAAGGGHDTLTLWRPPPRVSRALRHRARPRGSVVCRRRRAWRGCAGGPRMPIRWSTLHTPCRLWRGHSNGRRSSLVTRRRARRAALHPLRQLRRGCAPGGHNLATRGVTLSMPCRFQARHAPVRRLAARQPARRAPRLLLRGRRCAVLRLVRIRGGRCRAARRAAWCLLGLLERAPLGRGQEAAARAAHALHCVRVPRLVQERLRARAQVGRAMQRLGLELG